MLYVASKRALPRKCARAVLFRPIKKKSSFNPLRVLDLFLECLQSTLFQILLKEIQRLNV